MLKYMHPSKKSRAIVIFSISASLLLHAIGIYFLFEHPFSLHSDYATISLGAHKSYPAREKRVNTEKLETLRDAFNYIVSQNECKMPQKEVAMDPTKLVMPEGEVAGKDPFLEDSLEQLSIALDQKAKREHLDLQGVSSLGTSTAALKKNNKTLISNSLQSITLRSMDNIKIAQKETCAAENQHEKDSNCLQPTYCESKITINSTKIASLPSVGRPAHWAPFLVNKDNQIEHGAFKVNNTTPKKTHIPSKATPNLTLPDEVPKHQLSNMDDINYQNHKKPKKEATESHSLQKRALFASFTQPEKSAEKVFTLYGNNAISSPETDQVAVGKRKGDYRESLSIEKEFQKAIDTPKGNDAIDVASHTLLHESSSQLSPKLMQIKYLVTTQIPSYPYHFSHNGSSPLLQFSPAPLNPQGKITTSTSPIIAYTKSSFAINQRKEKDAIVTNCNKAPNVAEEDAATIAIDTRSQPFSTEPSYFTVCDILPTSWELQSDPGDTEEIEVPKNCTSHEVDSPFDTATFEIAVSFTQDESFEREHVMAEQEEWSCAIAQRHAQRSLDTVREQSPLPKMVLENYPLAQLDMSTAAIKPTKRSLNTIDTSLLETIYESNPVSAVAHLVKSDEVKSSYRPPKCSEVEKLEKPQIRNPQFQVGVISTSDLYNERYPKPTYASFPVVERGQTDQTPSRSEAGELNEARRFTRYNLITMPDLSDLDTVSLESEFITKVQVSTKKRNGMYIFSVELEPRNYQCLQPMNQNYTFIIDRSNGIEKSRLKTYCDGVTRAIQQLKSDDSFNIILVDNDIVKMSTHSIYKSALSIRAAKQFLSNQQPGYRHSSPNLSALLLKIGKVAETSPLHNTVFLLSNGKALDPFAPKDAHLQELIRGYKNYFTLFTATACHGNENAHLQMMSKFFKGTHLHSQTNAAFPRKFASLVKKAGSAVAKNVKAFVATAPESVQLKFFPNNTHIPDVYLGRSIRLYGQTSSLCNFELLVQGQAGNEWVNIRQKIDLKEAVQSPVTFDRELLRSNGYDLFDRYLEENEISYLEQAKEILAPEMGVL